MIGLVGFGSTVERSWVDEWSDHDFGWLTVPGVQDRFRHDLSWLPAAERIALSVVENHGGVKVIYDDGHVLEFGIASLEDFTHWTGDQAAVIVDKGGVAEAVAALLARSATAGETDPVRAVKLLVTQILIGVGRARRGETLAAAEMICSDGQGRLLSVIGARLPRDAFVFNTLEPLAPFRAGLSRDRGPHRSGPPPGPGGGGSSPSRHRRGDARRRLGRVPARGRASGPRPARLGLSRSRMARELAFSPAVAGHGSRSRTSTRFTSPSTC